MPKHRDASPAHTAASVARWSMAATASLSSLRGGSAINKAIDARSHGQPTKKGRNLMTTVVAAVPSGFMPGVTEGLLEPAAELQAE